MIVEAVALVPRTKLGGNIDPAKRAWLRRQAIHIAAQLPENAEEARYVLDAARELIDSFLADKENGYPLPFKKGG